MVTDLTGQRFERLVVLGSADKRYFYTCQCDCGVTKDVRVYDLKNGHTKSCRCVQKETVAARAKHGHNRKGRRSLTYNSFHSMRQRCLDPLAGRYPCYGGANPPVTICDRWLGPDGFSNFLSDLGERPVGTTLGRFGDVGNYEPGNCAWQTPAEQAANRRPDRKQRGTAKKKIKAINFPDALQTFQLNSETHFSV